MSRVLVQVTLRSGTKLLTTWVDDDPRVKVGSVISLKDNDRKWIVTEKYDQTVIASDLEWHRKWTNNI